jgi:predicted nucleic acid-binding protein
MKFKAAVIDTNVAVAGILTNEPASPTARVLDGMLSGAFVFLISADLLVEYRRVLLRPKIAGRHGLNGKQIDSVLTEIVANGIVREPDDAAEKSPGRTDQHLWDLLATEPGSVLVTGDLRLLRSPPQNASVVTPATWIDL